MNIRRWHILGIICWYSKNYCEGEIACKKAIEYGERTKQNVDIDRNNLKFYLDLKKENDNKPKMTKKEFIKHNIPKLKKENPNLKPKQLQA